jgi:hypothetical protein
MSRYNLFVVEVDAPDGSGTVECEFEAYAGLLDMMTVRLGEPLLPAPPDELRGPIAPDLEALSGQRPFWVYAIGTCGASRDLVVARLHFKEGRFDRFEIVPEPDNLYDWGWDATKP